MADGGVARSPSRLCGREGKICCYGDALSTIFLLAGFCALLPTCRFSFFLFFLFLFFPASRYFYLLRVPSSVQQPSATLSKYVFYSTCSSACVICTLPHPGITLFFYSFSLFFVALICRLAFFLSCSRTRHAST